MREIPWPGEELAPQEGRWSMEWDNYDNLREKLGNDQGSVWSIVSWLHSSLNGIAIDSFT